MTPPTPFEIEVMCLVAKAHHGATASDVRRAISARIERATGRKPHQAAIAANLTKLVWKKRYVDGFVSHGGWHIYLTTDGTAWLAKNPFAR